ncbi:hypothetical protein BMQ_pBM60069 (plasmid) [Priestia megaterium QM B1551]|uniref:Uncharacterized protein n=1 Tax=Priestia megaterium (strain ATCC 12872 / QMB1551) TaxID=545693 RepID=D5E3X6_PRIM1|nr:hypothetical protein BMQ_pBM60069 [Priestia megaterium QM B1551]
MLISEDNPYFNIVYRGLITAIFISPYHLYKYKVTLQTSIEFTILLCIFFSATKRLHKNRSLFKIVNRRIIKIKKV